MPNQDHLSRVVSALAVFSTLAKTKAKQAVLVASMLLIPFTSLAQNRDQDDHQPQTTPPSSQSSSQTSSETATAATAQPSTVTIPAGTRFALVLTNPVSSKTMHRGDVVYAQTTAPVTVGDQVLIPAGTFIQGKVDKLTRNGNRAEMLMTSAKVVFPDGYVANITGPLNVASDEGTAWRDPGDGAKAGAILAPIAGGGLGALIGSAFHSTQSATLGGTTISSSTPRIAIGAGVGLAVGAAVMFAILLHSHGFFVDVGSPMEMTLPQPLTLSENRVADAVRQAEEHPVAAPMPAPRPLPYAYDRAYERGTCYTPGTPGTPPTIIPGTPAIGDSPGTPATVIPGTPAIPGTPYPCP
jgi:hypothetical protein